VTARILVVDDAPAIRRSVRLYLEQEGNWIICGEAENGKVAIDRVRELRPDVVILDLSMPVMNGLEAARVIKTIAPGTRILMFTRHTYPYLSEEAGRRVLITCFPRRTQKAGIYFKRSTPWSTNLRAFLFWSPTPPPRS
jgi:DNA-binding NarL/FixJ family response regulator